MVDFDIIFISACCDHRYIYKLVESIINNNNHVKLCLIVVNQNDVAMKQFPNTSNTHVNVIEHNEKVNSSIARNIGIDYLLNHQLVSEFVCFPDDDSSYDGIFFEKIQSFIKSNKLGNYVTDVYCTGSSELFRKVSYPDFTVLSKKDFNIVGAVNIVLNFKTFQQVLYFDSRFGVNAKYGAGEDGDYFIRAVQLERFYYTKELYSYHPSGEYRYKSLSFKSMRKRLSGYACGGIALLCKHRMYKAAIILTFRAIGGVAKYLLKREFKIAIAYLEAFFLRFFYLVKFSMFSVK
ncbi:MAG: glycosyltransferase [Pyrinomonadaceae bacterium]|nr:glycosyltransferase [Sphingobacteriaceae bacterium]